MASGVGKHKLLSMGPTEPWSVREKLCLATSVMKSGDQNWVSVSRAIKPFAEPGRPPDWFSQKHCASQYSGLLETTEAPKRKRGEKGEVVETVEDVIVRRLTAERIDELKRLIKDTQEKHRKLKREAELIQSGHLDTQLEELWSDILQKKKEDDETAEEKRRATDAAYQARQAVKNTPKRVPSVTVRSPPGCGSPGLEFPHGDALPNLAEDPGSSVPAPGAAVFMPLTETSVPGAGEGGLGAVLEDSLQKKLLVQKATPPPSPLLSELLKKGSLFPTSPRLVGDGDLALTAAHDLQLTAPNIPGSQATGAPTLSRLLEAGPAQFSSLGSLSSPESSAGIPLTSTAPAMDCPAALHTGGEEVASAVPAACQSGPGGEKVPELGEEDLVTVSYMGDELDLETVGDIIAIIEDKGDENSEALDAAAVEAALSLCEESGHALSGPWEAPFRAPESGAPLGAGPSQLSSLHPASMHAGLEGKRESGGPRGGCGDGSDRCPSAYSLGVGGAPPPPSSSSSCSSSSCGSSGATEHGRAFLQAKASGGGEGEGGFAASSRGARKRGREAWTQRGANATCGDLLSEGAPATAVHQGQTRQDDDDGVVGHAVLLGTLVSLEGRDPFHSPFSPSLSLSHPLPPPHRSLFLLLPPPPPSLFSCPPSLSLSFSLSPTPPISLRLSFSPLLPTPPPHLPLQEDEGPSDGEDGSVASDAKEPAGAGGGGEDDDGEGEGPEEEEEGYPSEAEGELERASESEDGSSLHTASSSLRLHAAADSVPSSPASSQFSMSSEDQEAIQAQKIWKKAIMLVWRAAANHRYANVFLQPVTDDIAPGYHSIVHRPMDLSTIKKNIETGQIRTTAEFQRDIMLMFQNAVMYNSSDHDVFHMGLEMQRDVLEQIQQFLATQLIMQTSESGISAKSLRGRESARKQDPSDKDSVPMASPAFLLSLFDGGTRGRRCAIEADLKMKK
ncbi:LOW QUALITY PROTEIN: bromodomain-containing protein 8 [Osmerus eperlanus]|uniref:LOW QUALITY PROTEIN: bromodomain-containing protein 8 n=1 Tax=Osmerus eperlanus TaxID=29151 RepID=UPI002E0EC4BE